MPFALTIQHIHHLDRRSFRFLKELGCGEYGSVVCAEKRSSSNQATRVALKLTECVETFLAELQIFNLLGSHPNIVGQRGSFSDRFIHVIELEYLTGQTLLDFILAHGSLREDVARQYFAQLVSGMLHSHEVAKVAHRDIKAENLMVCGEQLFILDWGMGSPVIPDHYHTGICGSPDYAAPEIYLGQPYKSTEVDVWAMGVVLFAMITGEFPFPGASPAEVATAICRRSFKIPTGVSQELLDLLSRMLAKNPRCRITIQQIQQHPWVRAADHHGLLAANAVSTATGIQEQRNPSSHALALNAPSSVAVNRSQSMEPSPRIPEGSQLPLDRGSALEKAAESKSNHRRGFALQNIFRRKRSR